MNATRGLYAVTPDTADTDMLISRVRAAIEGGARCVQYRNKVASNGLRLEQARALRALCTECNAALIINDHIDLAEQTNADGVHLGREDDSGAIARQRLGSDKLIGISCYRSLERAFAARDAGADYVAFGSFFPSSVKPNAVQAPIDLLREAKRSLTLPVVAIGGITVDNAPQLIDAGADALAVISALFGAPDAGNAARAFTRLFESAP